MEYPGNIASPGIAFGKSFVFKPYIPRVEQRRVAPKEVEHELEILNLACSKAREELDVVIAQLIMTEPEKAAIFTAYQSIIDDVELLDEIRQNITVNLQCASWATRKSYDEFSALLREADDPYLSERASDMEDICNRILRCVDGVAGVTLSELSEPCLVVAEELFPSDTVLMDVTKILGLVTEKGGITSHTAIIARSNGIPSLLGVKHATQLFPTGTDMILDALEGKVITQADNTVLEHYTALHDLERHKREITAAYLKKAAFTQDDVRIDIEVNIDSVTPSALTAAGYTDGVGLFRTEFLYMETSQLPDEQTQYEAYRAVLEAYGDKPVVLRTLDIGGDKTLSYKKLPREDNPALGKRALRLCLDEPDLFRTQLRAALRASSHGNLWVMFPMVGGLEELRAAKQAVIEATKELNREGLPYNPEMKLGTMIEIPSAALIADHIAEEVDFASIGTNDLIQYLTAADRLNSEVSQYYQMFHPAAFRIIKRVADAFRICGKDLCVCGELGGNPAGAVALIGLGLRRLSMSPSSVAKIKHVIASITIAEAEEAAQKILAIPTTPEIEAFLNLFLYRKGLR